MTDLTRLMFDDGATRKVKPSTNDEIPLINYNGKLWRATKYKDTRTVRVKCWHLDRRITSLDSDYNMAEFLSNTDEFIAHNMANAADKTSPGFLQSTIPSTDDYWCITFEEVIQ